MVMGFMAADAGAVFTGPQPERGMESGDWLALCVEGLQREGEVGGECCEEGAVFMDGGFSEGAGCGVGGRCAEANPFGGGTGVASGPVLGENWG